MKKFLILTMAFFAIPFSVFAKEGCPNYSDMCLKAAHAVAKKTAWNQFGDSIIPTRYQHGIVCVDKYTYQAISQFGVRRYTIEMDYIRQARQCDLSKVTVDFASP